MRAIIPVGGKKRTTGTGTGGLDKWLVRACAGAALATVGTGCTHFEKMALRRSEKAYRPTTTETYAPKPETDPMPFVDKVPKKSRVIGLFYYSTERRREFALRAIQHNARKAGADAVWLRGIGEGRFPVQHHEPAHWEARPFILVQHRRYAVPNPNGGPARTVSETVPTAIYQHRFIPAQDWTEFVHYTTVDALMLKLP